MQLLFVLACISLAELTSALHIPVTAHKRTTTTQGSGVPTSRQSLLTSVPLSVGQLNITNLDILYTTVVTIDGQDFTVQIDTGSADLWVSPQRPLAGTSATGLTTNITYGIGSVFGDIVFSSFSMGSFSVESQAVLTAVNTTSFQDNLFPLGVSGIIGMSLSTTDESAINSLIAAAGNDTAGHNPITNIFAQNTSAPNFITILLGRDDDLAGVSEGAFTISELIQGLENVTETPQLARQGPGPGRYTVLLDGFSVNGQNVMLNSSIAGVPSGQSLASLDTGATFSVMPTFMVDTIYSNIPNSLFVPEFDLWTIPCNSTADVRFSFGGQEIAIHPLDLSTVQAIPLNAQNQEFTICTATFQDAGLPEGLPLDMNLGDSFMRNVYALFDYGTLSTEGSQADNAFIQLLPLTDPQQAGIDFQTSRAKQLANSPPEASRDQIMANITGSAVASNSTATSASASAATSSSTSTSSSKSSSSSARSASSQNAILAESLLLGLVTITMYFTFGA